jgi:hypothetical protein
MAFMLLGIEISGPVEPAMEIDHGSPVWWLLKAKGPSGYKQFSSDCNGGGFIHRGNLIGFGKCLIQLCNCQEIPATSITWAAQGKCDLAPDKLIELVTTMRLKRDIGPTPTEYPQAITVTQDKVHFGLAGH